MQITDLENHKIADLFPMMNEQEFNELKEDILQNGLRESIWTYENKILDGRNRYKACFELGIDPTCRQYDGNDPVSFVVSLNLKRRHLDTAQRAMVAARIANLSHGQKKADVGISTSQPEAAKILNVSRESVVSAKKVLNKGSESLIQKVDSGQIAVSTAANISSLPKEDQVEIVDDIEAGTKPSEALRVHVSNNSGNNEWYTPIKYIELARQVMGWIDLDPASSDIANRTVKANTYYTHLDDGLSKKWYGKIWMNPPYSQPLISQFAENISAAYEDGDIEQACILINNATETQWFQRIINSSNAVCFPKSRIKFIDPNGRPSGAPLQGQAIIYMGANVQGFINAFGLEGVVLTHG